MCACPAGSACLEKPDQHVTVICHSLAITDKEEMRARKDLRTQDAGPSAAGKGKLWDFFLPREKGEPDPDQGRAWTWESSHPLAITQDGHTQRLSLLAYFMC